MTFILLLYTKTLTTNIITVNRKKKYYPVERKRNLIFSTDGQIFMFIGQVEFF